MDIEQLKTFTLILEFNSFSKAALALHISQPTVSMRMRALEEELGQTLIERRGKELILTPAGESFLKYAKQLVVTASEAKRNIQEFSPPTHLSIGATPLCANYILTHTVSRLRRSPQFNPIHLRTIPQQQQVIDMFLEGILDVGMFSAASAPRSAQAEQLWAEPVALVVNPNHPLAQLQVFHLANFEGNEFISLIPDQAIDHFGKKLLNLCHENAIPYTTYLNVDNVDYAKQLAMQNNLLAFLSLLNVEQEIAQGDLISLPYSFETELSNHIYLLMRDGQHKQFALRLREDILQFGKLKGRL